MPSPGWILAAGSFGDTGWDFWWPQIWVALSCPPCHLSKQSIIGKLFPFIFLYALPTFLKSTSSKSRDPEGSCACCDTVAGVVIRRQDSTWRPLTHKSHVTMDHYRPLYVGDTVPDGLWQLCAPDDLASETDSSFIKSVSRWVAVTLWQHCRSTVSDLTFWRQCGSLLAGPLAVFFFCSNLLFEQIWLC